MDRIAELLSTLLELLTDTDDERIGVDRLRVIVALCDYRVRKSRQLERRRRRPGMSPTEEAVRMARERYGIGR